MKTYRITAKTLSGNVVEEVISAEDEFSARRLAAEKNLFVTRVKEVRAKGSKKKSLKTKELIIFCQLMSAMLNAGTTVDKALNLAREKSEEDHVREIYGILYEEVQKGTGMADAMEITNAFPQLLVNMVNSGATTGNMGEVFSTMADFYEKEAELNRKVKSAMIYPIVLAVMAVSVVIILTVFVLPGIVASFESDQPLPFLTSILMSFSGFLTGYWYLIIGGIIGGVFGARQLLENPENKIKFDKMKLSVPVAGPLLKTIYSARAARTIASLYENGANMLVIVRETGGTIGNKYAESQFEEVYVKVSSGEKLSSAIEATELFDPMLHSMIEVGEEAGDLRDVLKSTAKFFNNEADAATEQLVSLLEPIFLIVMGAVIGIIVIAIMQPMMSMYDGL